MVFGMTRRFLLFMLAFAVAVTLVNYIGGVPDGYDLRCDSVITAPA